MIYVHNYYVLTLFNDSIAVTIAHHILIYGHVNCSFCAFSVARCGTLNYLIHEYVKFAIRISFRCA